MRIPTRLYYIILPSPHVDNHPKASKSLKGFCYFYCGASPNCRDYVLYLNSVFSSKCMTMSQNMSNLREPQIQCSWVSDMQVHKYIFVQFWNFVEWTNVDTKIDLTDHPRHFSFLGVPWGLVVYSSLETNCLARLRKDYLVGQLTSRDPNQECGKMSEF